MRSDAAPTRDVWKYPRKDDVIFSPAIGLCTVLRANTTRVLLRNTVSAALGIRKNGRHVTRAMFVVLGGSDGAEVRSSKACRPSCSTVSKKVNAGTRLPCRRMRDEATLGD